MTIIYIALSGCGRSEQSPGAIPEPSDPAAQDAGTVSAVHSNPLRDAFFGETHMHTAYSLDAYIGGTRLTPSDAYRFARDEFEPDGFLLLARRVDNMPHLLVGC